MKKILLLTFCFLQLQLSAQNKKDMYLLKGELIGEVSKQHIPYALIYIKGKRLGVASTDKGLFEFGIDPVYFNDTIEIKAMGYKLYTAPIASLQNQSYHTIMLRDTVFSLTEVTIPNIAPVELVRRALDKTNDNFPDKPYEMDCYYATTLMENNKYVKMTQCLFRAFDRGFNYNDINRSVDVSYIGVRKSNDYTNPRAKLPYPFFRPQWLLTSENYARNKQAILNNINRSYYDFEYAISKYYNGAVVYVVDAIPKASVDTFIFNIRFYIREKDYAIIQMDFDGKDKIAYCKASNLPVGLDLKVRGFRNTYLFKQTEGRMYMHFLNNNAQYDWYDAKTHALLTSCEENSEAVIQKIKQLSKSKSTIRRPERKDIPSMKYKPELWDNEDMVSQIPIADRVKTDLESEMPLEKQYQKNGERR